MPRYSDGRAAAEPSSAGQKARHRRIIKAAARLGAAKGLDGMQMQDVAKEAGVAIATLYRYFPSKTHLFTAVLADQLGRLNAQAFAPGPHEDPVDAVADLLIGVSRQLLDRPLLAHAMLQSNLTALATKGFDTGAIKDAFVNLMLRILGIDSPTAHDMTLARLLEQCWFGVLTSLLNGRNSMAEAEPDIRLACRLLLAPRSNAGAEGADERRASFPLAEISRS